MSNVKKWFTRAAETARGLRRAIGSFWSRTGPARQRWRVCIVAAVLFLAGLCTVLAFLPGQVTSTYDWLIGGGKKEGAWGNLRIQPPVSLTDGDPRQTQIGTSAHLIRATVPQIDFTVRNEGAGRIPLSRIRIEVTDSTRITSCLLPQGGEGGIPVAEEFTASLPLLPAASEKVVYRNLHQEVLPQRASRFKLYLRSLEGGFGDNLFAIDVLLLGTEQGETLHVGRFVLSLPGSSLLGVRLLPHLGSGFRRRLEDALAPSHHLVLPPEPRDGAPVPLAARPALAGDAGTVTGGAAR